MPVLLRISPNLFVSTCKKLRSPFLCKKKTTTSLLSYWCRFLDLSQKWWSFFVLGGPFFWYHFPSYRGPGGFRGSSSCGWPLTEDWTCFPWHVWNPLCDFCLVKFGGKLLHSLRIALQIDSYIGVGVWNFEVCWDEPFSRTQNIQATMCVIYSNFYPARARMSAFLSAMGFYGCISTSCKSMLLMGLHDPTKSSKGLAISVRWIQF